jgi:hypothetical protein
MEQTADFPGYTKNKRGIQFVFGNTVFCLIFFFSLCENNKRGE